jgi:hypothetical protein
MIHTILRIILMGAALLPLAAQAFNVGPYRIGMTAVEARRVGIGRCSPDISNPYVRNRIVCEVSGEATPLNGTREAKIWFDSSRRVNEIYVVIDDAAAGTVEPKLKMAPCPAKWENGPWCYKQHDLVRKVWRDSSRGFKPHWLRDMKEPLRIHVEYDRAHVKSFIAARERQTRQDREVAAIQGNR